MEEQLTDLYTDAWMAMASGNSDRFDACFTEDFVIVHMTGKRQTRDEFYKSILDGTLRYYSERIHKMNITFTDDTHADVIGHSLVGASIHDTGLRTWCLLMSFKARKEGNKWRFCYCEVGTWKGRFEYE